MENIQSSIFYSTGMSSPHLSISAKIITSDTLVQDARWKPENLNIGDEVCIRLIDSDAADLPEKYVSFGTKLHSNEQEELFCSFCGQSQENVKKLVRGAAANVCNECIKALNDSFDVPKKVGPERS